MNIITSAYRAITAFLKAYPGGTAGVVTALVALGAAFGLHVTAQELATVVATLSVVAGVIVHMTTVRNTLPNIKLTPLPAAIVAPVVAPEPPAFPALVPVADEASVPVAVPVVEPAPVAVVAPVVGPGAPLAVERHP